MVTPDNLEDKEIDSNVEIGLDFILDHFDQNRLFPRTIMTKKIGYQKEVFSKKEVLEYFKESDFIDCRINAFPSFTEYQVIQRYPPDFIFIDLDKNNFKTNRSFELGLSKTLRNIKEQLNDGHPSVLWTGNGYHIYQPLDSFVLEEFSIFQEFENPSKQFLRFVKDFLSNNKADHSNTPSFKSCLLRIPFSFNSKYLSRGETKEDSRVKVIQAWNNVKPAINYLLRDFREYLITQKVKEKLEKKKRDSGQSKFIKNTNEILWIEKLLQTPIADYRKNTVSLVLSPYLINIKKLAYPQSYEIINDWLSKCNQLKRLDEKFHDRIKRSLTTAVEKKSLPMKLVTLKERNLELFIELSKNLKI